MAPAEAYHVARVTREMQALIGRWLVKICPAEVEPKRAIKHLTTPHTLLPPHLPSGNQHNQHLGDNVSEQTRAPSVPHTPRTAFVDRPTVVPL